MQKIRIISNLITDLNGNVDLTCPDNVRICFAPVVRFMYFRQYLNASPFKGSHPLFILPNSLHADAEKVKKKILVPTADQTGQGLPEEGQQLAELRQGPGVSGVALQHGAAHGHVERGRIHRVHVSWLSGPPARSAPSKRCVTFFKSQPQKQRCIKRASWR